MVQPVEEVHTLQMHINGQWRPADTGKVLFSHDPYTGKRVASMPDAEAQDVALAVEAARKAFDGPWRKMNGTERSVLMRRLAELIRRDSEELALIESRENGKLLRELVGQWKYMPAWLDYFAGLADKIEGATLPSDRSNFLIHTRKEPAGVVAAITPWNSPGMLLLWKLAPALAAGCTFVCKPSEYTPSSALGLARLVEEAGFPPGVYNVVTGGAEAGKALVSDPRVDRIAFTGSTGVGKAIAKAAAENLAGVLLELGGKSPNIVFGDCDKDVAANGIIAGIFGASGQSCMAGSRLIIQRDVMDEVLAKVLARVEQIKIGDPRTAETELGPVCNEAQYRKIVAMIDNAVRQGARLMCGGAATEIGALFVRPTILTGVTPEMEIFQDEVFGPVLCVVPFDTEEEAVQLANDSSFGLAAGVWTLNVQRAHRVSERLRAGTVWINAYRVVSYVAPFGGFKQSGLGRENGIDAVNEYLETKTVWIELSGQTRDPFVVG
jgi:(Z)-2-((N-methylformamido)methylene)-5-hydroxybutyrolactone dehydrogenase